MEFAFLKTIFTTVSLASGIAIFVFYYISIFKKEAKPHLFSWTTWGILTGIGFVASLSEGGGEGAWIFALESILCLSVAGFALFRGEKNITRVDWVFFISAIVTMFVYVLTKNAVLSVFLAAIIDILGFLPTFRKSYLKPYNESVSSFSFSFLSYLFSLGALQTYSFVTIFYPVTLVITNGVFVLFLIIRRKAIKL